MRISHLLRTLCCLLLFVTISRTTNGQSFPVTASTQIIPPYSVYLPDYAVPGSDKLRVILVLNDMTVPSYDVRLQMTIERNGILIMKTSPVFNPRPISINAGMPVIIGGNELADYLNTANIDFSNGFSRDDYERTKSLPEGSYRITFTVYDYRRPTVQVSNAGANVFFFQKSDPPLLNLPVCGSRVEKMDPQFLTFSWSSRNTSNSSTTYIFSLWEVKPAGSTPDYITRSAKPVYTITTDNNTIIYGPGEPLLVDSMQYVWNVQAKDKNGRDLFSNNGLSTNCTFTYMGKSPFAQFSIPKPVLRGRAVGERSIRYAWDLAAANAEYDVQQYRLQYRATKIGSTEFDWVTQEKTSDSTYTANSLEPGRSYEARLQWQVAGVYGDYSTLLTVRTDSAKPFVCGDANKVEPSANNNPLPSAMVGNIVRVGHFDVLLTNVSGGNGTFTGNGRIITPGFGIGMLMVFKDITINTDMVMTKGEMQAATKGIDAFVEDKLAEQHGGNDVGSVVTGDVVPDIKTTLEILSPANIQVDKEAGTITLTDSKDPNKTTVIDYQAQGKQLPLVLEDADGNLYNVDKNGTVTAAGKRDASMDATTLGALNKLDLGIGKVTFAAGRENKYGFAAWNEKYAGKAVLEAKYESVNGYRVSSKAIVPGEQEGVVATITGQVPKARVQFVTGKGIQLAAKLNSDSTYTVTVLGGPGGDAQEVYAVYKDKDGVLHSVGKLLVVSYTPVKRKVVLIPLDDNVPDYRAAVEKSMNEVYGKVGVEYTVVVDGNFKGNKSWDNGDGVLQDKGSAFLSNNFTGEEKEMKKAYRKLATTNIEDDAVYLFMVNEAALADGDLLGKMPRGSQFGFLFTKNATEASMAKTVPHEVGHGDYTLEHMFSGSIGVKEQTGNLMDYGEGVDLNKYQWDVVHDPGSVWGVFEGDASQELVSVASLKQFEVFKNGKSDSYTFITPGGTYITIPGSATDVNFSTLDRSYYIIKGAPDGKVPTDDLWPLGSLLSFKVGDVTYKAYATGGVFKGYDAAGDGSKIYEDKFSSEVRPSAGIVVMIGVKNKVFVTYAFQHATEQKSAEITTPYYGTAKLFDDFSIVHFDLKNDTEPFERVLSYKSNTQTTMITLPETQLNFATQAVDFDLGQGTQKTIEDLLLTVLDENSPIKDYLTFYTLANMRKSDMEAYKSCMESAGWNIAIVPKLKDLTYSIEPGHELPVNEFYSGIRKKLLSEFAKYSDNGGKLAAALEDAVAEGKDAAALNKVFSDFYSTCALSLLSGDTRMYILEKLLSGNAKDDYWYTSNGTFILGDLIRSTPQKDRVKILKGFQAGNYEWINTLASAGEYSGNGVAISDIHNVMEAIVPWIFANWDSLGIKLHTKTYSDDWLPIESRTYLPGRNEFFLGLKNSDVFTYEDKNVALKTSYIMLGEPYRDGDFMHRTKDGKISMWQTYAMQNVTNPSKPGNVVVGKYQEDYDMFEPVTLRSASMLPQLNMNANERLVVPAYLAYLLYTDLLRVDEEHDIRQAFNYVNIGAAILAAPETAGLSLAYATTTMVEVAGAVSVVDEVVQKVKGQMTLEDLKANEKYFDAWESVYTKTNAVNGLVGGAGLTVMAVQKVQTFIEAVNIAKSDIAFVPTRLNMLKRSFEVLRDFRTAEKQLAAIKAEINAWYAVAEGTHIVIAAEDLQHLKAWMPKNTNNGKVIQVVVHSNESGTGFTIMRNGIQEALSPENLAAQILAHADADAKIVLYSCVNLDVAKEFGKQFPQSFYCNHGYVDLAESGAIAAEYPFVKISNGVATEVSISEFGIEMTAEEANILTAQGKVVRLGSSSSGAAASAGPAAWGDWVAVKAQILDRVPNFKGSPKKADQLIATMQKNPALGKRFLERLNDSRFKDIWKNESTFSLAANNEQNMRASVQALDEADAYMKAGYTPENLAFEDKIASGEFESDIDFGRIKVNNSRNAGKKPGDPTWVKENKDEIHHEYYEAYQFKALNGKLKGKVDGAAGQLFKAKADRKVVQLIASEDNTVETVLADEAVRKEFEYVLNDRKNSIDPSKRQTVDEVQVVFTDGRKLSFVWDKELKATIK